MKYLLIAKHYAWKGIKPILSRLRSTPVYTRIFPHSRRQLYNIGWLPNSNFSRAELFLQDLGFEIQHLAWLDKNEHGTYRKLVSMTHQIHIRIFNDLEVRGHLEYAPESYLIRHWLEIGISEIPEVSKNQIIQTLGLVSGQTVSQSAPAASRTSPSNG